jgi:chromosome partitioning protein
MQVWAVIAQKGGQSKTTLSTGFAVEAAREGASVVILDADDRQGSALYWSERRDMDDVMVKDSSVAGLPLHVSRGRSSGKIDLIIIDTPANSKTSPCSRPSRRISSSSLSRRAGWTFIRCCRP